MKGLTYLSQTSTMVEPQRSSGLLIYFLRAVGMFIIVCWISFLCLSLQYGFTRPTSKQPGQGRLYALNIHGRVAYLTHHEILNLYVLGGTSVALLIVVTPIALIIKRRGRTGNQ